MKKSTKAKKTASAKTATAKKTGSSARGCCTLTGSGPDEQHEGLTREACRLLAIKKNKNFQWIAGLCAEPD